MPFLLTSGAGNSLTDALDTFTTFITKAFSFMTQEPMVYFVVAGLIASAIGVFKKAKKAAK